MPNFTGEIGARYKAYEAETNNPNEYRFTGTYNGPTMQEDELEHKFINVVLANGMQMAERLVYDSAVGILYTLVKCRDDECLTGGRRRRRGSKRHTRRRGSRRVKRRSTRRHR
jgi:hypothetical protein